MSIETETTTEEEVGLTTAFQVFAERVSSVEQGYTKYDVDSLRIELNALDQRLENIYKDRK